MRGFRRAWNTLNWKKGGVYKIKKHRLAKSFNSNVIVACNPLMVCPPLAERLGLVPSLLLQQLHYWLCLNREREADRNTQKHFKYGRWWTYNTIDKWQRNNFPFLSKDTIKRGFKKLERMGVVVTANYNIKGYDRTKWYSINYEAVLALFPDSHLLMIHPKTSQIISVESYNKSNTPIDEAEKLEIINYLLGETPD